MSDLTANEPLVSSPAYSKNGGDVVIRIMTFVAVILLGTIASLLAIQTFDHPPEKWQYTVIAPNDANLENVLDKAGADGWEVVSARRASNGDSDNPTFSYELIMKKRGRETPAQPSQSK